MTAAFFLRQDVGFSHELLVRLDRTRLAQDLATLDAVTGNAADQSADVVAGLALVEQLAEHFNARNRRLRRVADADDFNFFADLDDAALNATGHNRTTTRDREHVFDRHQERLVDRTLRRRDVGVNSSHQLADRVFTDLLVRIFKSSKRRTLDDRDIVAREVVGRQKFANFQFNELEKLGVVNLVDLVEEHDDCRNANLAGKQDVLARLRHRAVSCRANQDRAVHLGSTGDHVLHVVGVAGAVDVRVVTGRRLVFNVCRRDRDTTSLFFRSRVDLVIRLELAEELRDCCRQRRLAMVNVTDRANVDVRLIALELALCHVNCFL
ncbi:hypothetical protein D3C72_995010 [compost metagenome]